MRSGRRDPPHMRRRVALFALCLLAAACGPAEEGGDAAAIAPERAPARRIVSLAPNLTEILFALDLADRVVGVTDYCDYPPEVAAKPRIGGYVNPNLEAILALEPDLALATPNTGNRDAVLRLQSLGVEFLIVETPTLEGLYDAVRRIADRAGVPDRGAALAGELRGQIEAIRDRVAGLPPTPAFLVFAHDPLIVAGQGSFFDDLITAAGGRNLAAEAGGRFPHLSLEQAVQAAPEAIVETVMGAGGEPDLAFWERWGSIPAVRDGRICAPPADSLLRPGPRAPEGVRKLAECFHPEAVEPPAARGDR